MFSAKYKSMHASPELNMKVPTAAWASVSVIRGLSVVKLGLVGETVESLTAGVGDENPPEQVKVSNAKNRDNAIARDI